MRRETLFKKLAAKTNYPLLEQMLLGEVPREELTMDCLVWPGTGGGSRAPRQKMSRSQTQGLRIDYVASERPYAMIKWQKKQIAVHRLLMLFLFKPSFEFKMRPQCPTLMCVNPLHFEIKEVQGGYREPSANEMPPLPDFDDPWTPKEIEELVDILLLEHNPTSWEDVIARPLMEGVPLDMVREHLISINKGHLT